MFYVFQSYMVRIIPQTAYSAATVWRVEQNPRIIFEYQVGRFAWESCGPRCADSLALHPAAPDPCCAAVLVEYPRECSADGGEF